MAHFILHKIKDYIVKVQFIAIMADGYTDVSGDKQFVQYLCSLRRTNFPKN
jgi:hypothetical protein